MHSFTDTLRNLLPARGDPGAQYKSLPRTVPWKLLSNINKKLLYKMFICVNVTLLT